MAATTSTASQKQQQHQQQHQPSPQLSQNLYHLSPDQQGLLLAALTSNSSSSPMFNTPTLSQLSRHGFHPQNSHHIPQDMIRPAQEPSPPLSAELDGYGGTPMMGSLDGFPEWGEEMDAGGWEFDYSDPALLNAALLQSEGLQIEESPVTATTMEGGLEKRKQPGDQGEQQTESEAKRRESDDKSSTTTSTPTTTAKKPGRKPLTSEPTSKRKAQNRAAQRAFRERKEKHLKDLEEKVATLTKASETANHENSILKAQIDRLETELREYKRRLQTSELSRSTRTAVSSLPGFQFDFPPFGGSNSIFTSMNHGAVKQEKLSPRSTSLASTTVPSYTTPFTDTHSRTPSLITHTTTSSSPSSHTTPSSCNTTPEPSTNQHHTCGGGDGKETETTFCEKLGMACGNPNNPIPKAPAAKFVSPILENALAAGVDGREALDWLAKGDLDVGFEPLLEGEFGGLVGEINGHLGGVLASGGAGTSGAAGDAGGVGGTGFFDREFETTGPPMFSTLTPASTTSPASTASPPTSAATAAAQALTERENLNSNNKKHSKSGKPSLIAQIDRLNSLDDDDEGDNADEEEEVVPAETAKMLSCNKIWDTISSHPKFQNGELDMDGLCQELRSKAKCSEAGVVVAENDVREVLGKVESGGQRGGQGVGGRMWGLGMGW
ncbi:hypothetical protein EX30DRAFT_385451 [Ascodesmis nigricans]|uniref:BZIP domain-containing protein n=1 Tax=Ascodesmis nigricans TaxID=341454 RepID=A0A4S2MR76_9PEZI|nr:hypothetical protein EX30DRAFT_385451 [Ascodesmis nigricans]